MGNVSSKRKNSKYVKRYDDETLPPSALFQHNTHNQSQQTESPRFGFTMLC
jgi:hypothetical protein